MTTPTGTIGLSHVQTEFGGVNPIQITEYYGKGTNTGGNPIALSQLRGASAVVEFPQQGALITRISTVGTTVAKFSIMPDGTLVNTGNSSICSTNWRNPTQAGIGSTFWVQCDDLQGVGSGFDPTGTPLPLSNGGKTWGFTTSFGTHISFPFRLRISRNSAMTQLVSEVSSFPIAVDN